MIWRGECLHAVLVLARPCERSANDDVSRLSQAAPLVRSNTASTEQSWANRRVETLSLAACAEYRHAVLVNARMTRRGCQMHRASSSSCQMAQRRRRSIDCEFMRQCGADLGAGSARGRNGWRCFETESVGRRSYRALRAALAGASRRRIGAPSFNEAFCAASYT